MLLLGAIPWRQLMTAAPQVVETAVEIYDLARGKRRGRPALGPAATDDLRGLRTEVAYLAERIDSLEGAAESQAELIARMARTDAALLRWVIALTVLTSLSIAVAAAALIAVLIL